jgi:hypothetical protein
MQVLGNKPLISAGKKGKYTNGIGLAAITVLMS